MLLRQKLGRRPSPGTNSCSTRCFRALKHLQVLAVFSSGACVTMVRAGTGTMVSMLTTGNIPSMLMFRSATHTVTGRLEPGLSRSGHNGSPVLLPRAGC